MNNIDFTKSKVDLPLICLGMMRNVSLEEQQLLANDIIKLTEKAESDKTKSINLGVLISNITGIKLLDKVVKSNSDIFSYSNEEADETNKKIEDLLRKYQ